MVKKNEPIKLYVKKTNLKVGYRYYSTCADSYFDADKDKLIILNITKNKSGIYMWINKENNKKYVGSSVNLRRRLLEYYNVNRLLVYNNMPINSALLKYGYNKFNVKILEFCDKKDLLEREKYYFEIHSPEYNILKTPGSPSRGSGWKHSEATIENMRNAALNRKKSLEQIHLLSTSQDKGLNIKVINIIDNTSVNYNAIRAAARAIGIDKRYIENYLYLDNKIPVLDKYIFELVKSDKNDTKKISKGSIKIKVVNVITNVNTVYNSISEAARDLKIRQAAISLYIKDNRTKPYKGLYLFKLI